MSFHNPQLLSEERAWDLLSRLLVSEKAALMCDISDSIPSLGVKIITGGAKYYMDR